MVYSPQFMKNRHQESGAPGNRTKFQTDGTTDSEFSMIVAVKDAVLGFALYVKKCSAESYESIKGILQIVKGRFGIPSRITSDIGSGILLAATEVFPAVPVRICLIHFPRGLSKDLMEEMHLDLERIINRIGVKSLLEEILRSILDYDQKTLYEIESRYWTYPRRMEVMAGGRCWRKFFTVQTAQVTAFRFHLSTLNSS